MSKTEHEVYTIKEIKDEAKDVKTFRFGRMILGLPGEFVMVWLPGVSENPFSISYNNPFGITAKKVGDEHSFTSNLFKLKVGDRLWVRGHYGRGFPDIPVGIEFENHPAINDIYLVAGGTGAIPLAFFSQIKSIFGFSPTVLLGAKTKDEIIFEERFREYSKKLLVSTDDGSYGYKGLVTDLFDKAEIKPNSLFYICGPEKMMKVAAEKAMQYTDADDIFLSLERYMKCGSGPCGSCEINGYRVCADGPVFLYSQIRGGDFGMYARTKSGTKVKL
jgi:dihydroorotate dehydrogenase electron transfer subunit